jgi:DNA polymerase III epsilon subunit-like protein
VTLPDLSEEYFCVDVEAAGPIPGDYSLLSIGACKVLDPETTFYIELRPVNENRTPEATAVHQLSLNTLMAEGIPPALAMEQFDAWLLKWTADSKVPVFVAFNAPFDWMFINYYFLHYLGRNPFGHAALDIKAFYMGQSGVSWLKTAWRFITPQIDVRPALTHHALQDALDQANLFKKLLQAQNHISSNRGES